MTSVWKTHGGLRTNNKVKSNTVLFDNSNYWKSGLDGEIFHFNGNSKVLVGLGTELPKSRLSFGDSSLQSRLSNLNNANIALNELTSGQDATGMGFYELYQQTGSGNTRQFTGIKFIVNNGTIDTMDSSNVSMLLRSDNRLIIGHDITNAGNLAPFGNASLDVSGSVRTTRFFIMDKVISRSGQPQGSIRYDGNELKYINDNNDELTIQTSGTGAAVATWSDFTSGNSGVYKQSGTSIASLRGSYSATDNKLGEIFKNKLAVEGSVSFGTESWLQDLSSIKGLSSYWSEETNPNDGVLALQRQLGIATREPRAAIDASYNDFPYLIIGDYASEVSNNSVSIGRNNKVKSNNSFSFGNNSIIESNFAFNFGESNQTFAANSLYNYIVGSGNDISSNYSYIFGNNNFINSLSNKHNMIIGESNQLFDSSNITIFGNDNRVGVLAQGESNSAKSCHVYGNRNRLINGSHDIFLVGNNNYSSNSKNSFIMGQDVSLNDINYGMAIGYKADISGDLRFVLGTEEKNGNAFTIDKYGSLEATGNAIVKGEFFNYSDIRLKTNIKTIRNALYKTKRLRGVEYIRNDTNSNKKHIGLIAQEVKNVLPEVVNEGEGGYMSVNYSNIVSLLIESVKELANKNERLERRIKLLENRNRY